MSDNAEITNKSGTKILLVDDEDHFRTAMGKQLTARGYRVLETNNGEDAIKIVRHKNPQVVILDQRMPKMNGVETLKEIKKIRPETQVIMLTGYGDTEHARQSGKLDVFRYMQKPCGLEDLISKIEEARQEHIYAMVRNEIPVVQRTSIKRWLIGAHNARPGVVILAMILFAVILAMPPSKRLTTLLTTPKSDQPGQAIAGYAGYRKMKIDQTITDYYSHKAGFIKKTKTPDGKVIEKTLSPKAVSFRAKVMVGTLVVAALFWATGAIPIGMTAILVGVLMYFFGVLPPNQVAQAYAKDSVIFIFGVLTIAAAVTKTGLDKRIGILLLGTSTSLMRFTFIFAPLLAICASFLSEHALVAFIAPVLVLVYGAAVRAAKIQKNRALAVMMILLLCYAANIGGPGSPAAGGRNAVMLSIFSDYGIQITFGEWVKYGIPFVPVMAVVIGTYFYLIFRKKITVKNVNIAKLVRRESEKIGKMTKYEYRAAGILILLILLWSTVSSRFGMGGPVILAIVLLNIFGVLRWRDVNSIHWDVVALYAAASAMGVGLAYTGAALWLADSFVSILPTFLKSGEGLAISSSLFTGILTNFMSDGATVAAIGPITIPMATLSNTSPLMVGLATAFASSFAHMLIIGTPNNAIAYSMAKDPETGEQLLTMKDFLIHGSIVLLLSLGVLWLWAFFGYWRWIGF